MEKIIINPEDYQQEYIRYINECFNGWGQDREYIWAFDRRVGDKNADIMIIENEEGEVIAGSAVTYRKLRTPKGNTIDIAIMTGSWTLPKARGKGCFSKIISLSQGLAAKKEVPYLTAFVTESNASFRRLRDAGSILLPSSLLFSPEETFAGVNTPEVQVLQESEEVVSDIYSRFRNSHQATLSYDYTPDEFYQQYIHRPKKVEILKIGKEYAVVEETHNVIRPLLLTYESVEQFTHMVKSLTNWALENRSKKLLLFSTRTDLKEACEKLGFEVMQGYFTILPTADDIDPEELMQLNINMGDKM